MMVSCLFVKIAIVDEQLYDVVLVEVESRFLFSSVEEKENMQLMY